MPQPNDETLLARERLAKDIVGEIVLSEQPEEALKKWRAIFHISQKQLAAALGITSSVISDYESGRRQSPGIKVVKRYITALLDLDAGNGAAVTKSFSKTVPTALLGEAVLDIREFTIGVPLSTLCDRINAQLLTKGTGTVYGYTVIDSLKAITELSAAELVKLYGLTTQRALIFTKVSTGRTPMVAIKLTNLRPGLVVLHGLQSVDEVACRIAEAERIPLAVCRLERPEDIVSALRKLA